MKYDDAREILGTGDVILFGGTRPFARIIKMGTRSRWSHVGLVVRMPGDLLLLWESFFPLGVQLTALRERVLGYAGDVHFRRRIEGEDPNPQIMHRLRRRFGGRSYERDWGALAAAVSDYLQDGHEDVRSLFCSELAARCYQDLGWLHPDPPSDSYRPHDWSEGGTVESRLTDEGGVLGDLTRISDAGSQRFEMLTA